MKKLLALFVLILTVSVTAVHAQNVQGWGNQFPGIQHMILEFGDELNLTDKQKADLLAIGMEHRDRIERREVRGDRRRADMRGSQRGSADRQRGVQGQRRATRDERMQERRTLAGERHQQVYDLLTGEQIEKLHTLCAERIQQQHDLRVLQNRVVVEKAGIEGRKAEQLISLLNRQSELRSEMQIQNVSMVALPDTTVRQNLMEQISESNDEIKNLLTAAEYQKLRDTMRPAGQRRGTGMRRGR
jgi:Spy/CpxP family protein refolding chaperone